MRACAKFLRLDYITEDIYPKGFRNRKRTRYSCLAAIWQARMAAVHNRFGAVWGEGVGLHGQTYAIPTMQGGVETIKPYVDEFIRFAKEHSRLMFLVTRIGCGIAGFRDEEIAPLFTDAIDVENIILPKEFVACLVH